MSEKLTSEEPLPLEPGEYFDHVNACEVREVVWIEGDAFCPECDEEGVVYQS